jgi:hypothetical protein
MTATLRWATLVLAFGVAGCGDDEPELGTRIDCAWLQGNNCWKDTVEAAHACTNAAETGTFDVARTACVYPDSTEIRFDPSAPVSTCVTFAGDCDFTITSPDQTTCARVKATVTRSLTVTTSLGTFAGGFVGSTAVLTCADGSRFHMPEAELRSCPTEDRPDIMTRRDAASFAFGLRPAPTSGPWMWDCRF